MVRAPPVVAAAPKGVRRRVFDNEALAGLKQFCSDVLMLGQFCAEDLLHDSELNQVPVRALVFFELLRGFFGLVCRARFFDSLFDMPRSVLAKLLGLIGML